MKPYLETKRRIVQSGIDRRELAEQLGMTYAILGQKINGFLGWRQSELDKLNEILAEQKTK